MSSTLADLFVQINTRLVQMASEKQSAEERLRTFAAELGCEVWYCELPGCGKPFVKSREHHRFCGKDHKQVYANKYRRNGS